MQINAPLKYKPIRYFAITFAATFTLWFGGGYLSFQEEANGFYMCLMLPGLLAPGLVSGWMLFTAREPALKADALDRLLNPRRISLKQLPILLFLMPLIVLVSLLLSLGMGESMSQFTLAEGFSFSTGFIPVLLLLAFAALFEELGWRGYAFDSLLAGRSYLGASLIFSVLWSLWHLPLLWVNHAYQYNLLQENFWYAVNFHLSIVPMGIIMCWICAKNRRSVGAAVLFHFSINLSQEALAISQTTKCIETVILLLVAGALIRFDRDVFAVRPSPHRDVESQTHTPKLAWRHLYLAIFILVLPEMTTAQDPDPTGAGFSGTLQAGALFVQTDSQLSTAGSDRRVRGANGPADRNELTAGLATLSLRYDFENGTALYAGTPMEVSRGLALEAGVSRPAGRGTLDLSVNWLPMEEVWKNPYGEAGRKSETAADTYGMRVKWQPIGGGPWELGYALQRTSVERDAIGDLESDLKRSGWTHELDLKRCFPLHSGLSLTPGLGAGYGDKDGESNRYSEGKAELMLQGVRPPWIFVGLISGAYQHYCKAHPLYGDTRREAIITLFAQVIRRDLLGRDNLFASLGGGYLRSDANIDFFDSQSFISLATVGVDF